MSIRMKSEFKKSKIIIGPIPVSYYCPGRTTIGTSFEYITRAFFVCFFFFLHQTKGIIETRETRGKFISERVFFFFLSLTFMYRYWESLLCFSFAENLQVFSSSDK